jgi:glycosyltransferase involved in cell wall biosynthesis
MTGKSNPHPSAPRPARVLFLDHTAQLGGGEIALVDLVRNLDRTRVTPIVVLSSDGPLVERLRPHAEVFVLPLGSDILHTRKDRAGLASLAQFRKVLGSLGYARRLRRFILDHRIDLVHTNSLKADILGGIAGRAARRPVIWHIRDRIAEDYLPRSMVFLIRGLARVLPTFVVANSAATLATLRLNGKRPEAVIPSGVDLTSFSPGSDSPASSPDAPARIGIVGRISPWKGQHIFIQAAAQVHSAFPATRFLIIGAALFAEQAYEAELHQSVRNLGLEEVVEFTGFRNDVPQLVSSLSILVHASTTGEPFGQVIVQGMAAGLPVVATNGGGVPEIVQHGTTGLLVPMGDAHAMAQAICHLLKSPALAAEMGRQGRQRVLDHFTIEQTARKAEAVYQAVLARRPRPTAAQSSQS